MKRLKKAKAEPLDLNNYARRIVLQIQRDVLPDNAVFEQFMSELSNVDHDIRDELLNSTNVLIEELQNLKHQ